MKTITYQNNNQYWALKDALEEAGYTLKADCYWSQILRNDEGEEIGLSRETESTNNPLDDLTAVLAVEVKEETAMETINYVYVNQYVKNAAHPIRYGLPCHQGGALGVHLHQLQRRRNCP